MEGLRKLLATVAVVVLETGAFLVVVLVAKGASEGVLIAYFAAVVAALTVYTGANVASKFSPAAAEKAKEGPSTP